MQGASHIGPTGLKLQHHRHSLGAVLAARLDLCKDVEIAESAVISIKNFDGSYYQPWSLEVDILLEQKQDLSIVDGTDEAQVNTPDLKRWKKQPRIARWIILPTMERSLQLQYGIPYGTQTLWNQLKEDNKSNMKLNVCALPVQITLVILGNCENMQQYTLKILRHVNDFILWKYSMTISSKMA
jgi:hypothetical protein